MSGAVAAVNAVFLWNTTVDLSADANTVDLSGKAKMLASGGFGTVDETFKGGPRSWALKYAGFFNGGSSQNEQTISADFNSNTARTWILYPEGNVSTKRKFTGSGLIENYDPVKAKWDDLLKLTFDVKVSGAVTPSTIP